MAVALGRMWRHTTDRHTHSHTRMRINGYGGLHSKCGKEAMEGIYGLTEHLQVLAIDLLNPTPQAEARKHKLKVCDRNTFHSRERS